MNVVPKSGRARKEGMPSRERQTASRIIRISNLWSAPDEKVVRCSNLYRRSSSASLLSFRIGVGETILTATVFSIGCQLPCRIFFEKSTASEGRAGFAPSPFAFCGEPFPPVPIFLAVLKADLSAWRITSSFPSVSYMRK